MDAEVGQAYHTVQLSAKEMIKNNNRQHLCNMLDLLASSCKASGLIDTAFSNDELIQFWLSDLLPLVFDSERSVQSSAIAALAEALVALDVQAIHSSSLWPQIRNEFANKYTLLMGEMRDAKNSNWHKIWTLLVQIMDEDLLKGCVYINKFLSVVEMGFRNPDNGVRSEAFLCWRVLIKVFAAYNELAAPKRLRLLLIPLRTSQSRSSHVSGIKLRVWWYLLTCLDADLPKCFENAVEYFLSFTFGATINSVAGLAHNYQTARELALPCLVSLLGMESNEALTCILRDLRLESLTQPSPLMQAEVFTIHWKPMLAAAIVALDMLDQNDTTEVEQQLMHILGRNLTLAMFKLRVAPFIVSCCSEIEKSLEKSGRLARAVFNTIALENQALEIPTAVDSLEIQEAFMKLCLKAKTEVPASVLQRSVALIFSPEQNSFRQLNSLAKLLMQSTNDDEDFDGFGVKLHIWRQISTGFLNHLRENALDYRLSENASVLDSWLLWPLQACSGFAGRRTNSVFDSGFCEQWRQLLNAGHNAPDRKKFVGDLKAALKDWLIASKEEPLFTEFFDAYVAAVLKLGICKDAPLYKDVFNLLTAVFERQTVPQKMLEGCLNTLRNLVNELRQNELMVIFDALKPTLSGALQCWTKQKCEGGFLNEWKRSIQDKFRKLPMKNMANQLKELFKGDDLFVIIPSVWSLNPDKLTDRQKERFAEKSVIPALYNDMSQSQDSSSIKPWTPKKVVIAKNKQTELAISGQPEEDSPILIEDTPTEAPAEKLPVLLTPNRRRATIDSAAFSSDKYSFRKPRPVVQEEPAKLTQTKESSPAPIRVTRQRLMQKDAAQEPETNHKKQLRSPSKPRPQCASPAKSPTKKIETTEHPTEPPNSEATKVVIVQSEDLFPEAPPTQLPELPKKTVTLDLTNNILEVQLTPPQQETIAATVEPMQFQESSPRKTNARICNLNSPPDRKQTNNSTSPTLKPKPSAHLTGRGAQLINMIRNKKLDGSAGSRLQCTPARTFDRSELVSTPTAELNELTGTNQTSTPIQAKDLLIFSKRLPSPSASPSCSILKRKFRCESIDDISTESPAQKRKRVSFHDPPVSVTKEYLRDAEETRGKSKRCLLEKLAQTTDIKPALKRRGRLDSIIEIERFAKEQTARTASSDKAVLDKSGDAMEDEAFTSLKWNDNSTIKDVSNAGIVEQEPPMHDQGRDLAIMDTDAALNLLVEQCSLETVLDRFFAKNNSTPVKSSNTLAKFLSNQMATNDKLKANVLEILSENHPKEFLDHAVRENLSSVVCDRLNPNSVLDYVCAKSKINNTCRTNLLAQVPEILKSSRLESESERVNFVQDLVQQCSFSDSQILDLIAHLMRSRDVRESTSEAMVETAADSSSNL